MDFEFHFWRQNIQDSVTDFIPEMRGREIVGSPPQEFKGEKGNVTKLNAALEPAFYMCESQNWTRNSLRARIKRVEEIKYMVTGGD